MKMEMKPGVTPEDVDHYDHPQGPVVKTQHRAEEHSEAFVGAVAKLCQEPSVALEIDPQHDRDAEDELSMGNWVENGVSGHLPRFTTTSPLIPLRLTCLKAATILERSRNCWVHNDVKTTMIYTHVLNRGPAGVRSPVDGLWGKRGRLLWSFS